MPTCDTNFDRIKADVARLSAPDVLGFYTHFEVTEIFAFRDDERIPRNVFSILVAEERPGAAIRKPSFLGERIRLNSLKGWAFGLQQCLRPIEELTRVFEHFCQTKEWCVSGERLHVGALAPLPTRFVPPDSTASAPWNNVLKNNFWSGSHVLELMDVEKVALQALFDEPPRLQELSDAIQKRIPIRLASLSDRLGNVVLQLPITVLIGEFARDRLSGTTTVNVRWHSQATSRPLRASCEMLFDNTITTYASAVIEGPESFLPTSDGQGMQRTVLWDDQCQVVLAATGDTSFITTVSLTMQMLDPEPRVFTLKNKDGIEQQIRVGLSDAFENSIGPPAPNRGEEWTGRRIYRDEAARLAAQRRFVQYKPAPGKQDAEHERALQDVRLLLSRYGRHGAWLWDPYLGAEDVLRTLFYCPYKSADLRALTAGYERPPGARTTPTLDSIGRQLREWLHHFLFRPPPGPSFAEIQQAIINNAKSNLHGLRIEYRMKTGPSGWAFHDRFLIFPKTDSGTLAWSLGTSVNSLGRQHHILQQVDDGQLVADAFEDLWDQLGSPEHLVWKTP